MKLLLGILILATTMTPKIIFEFNKQSDLHNWRTVDDGVMGGKSSSTFGLNAEGYGVFEGDISLKNNGGFSSLRFGFQRTPLEQYTKVKIRLKGDGKKYQFRIKSNSSDYYSYIASFSTSGEWQEIEIPLKDMFPSFRGRRLDQPNFSHDYLEDLAFLIGNKREEKFILLLDKIELI